MRTPGLWGFAKRRTLKVVAQQFLIEAGPYRSRLHQSHCLPLATCRYLPVFEVDPQKGQNNMGTSTQAVAYLPSISAR